MTRQATAKKHNNPAGPDHHGQRRAGHDSRLQQTGLNTVSRPFRKNKALREIIAALMCSRLYFNLPAAERLALTKRHLAAWQRRRP